MPRPKLSVTSEQRNMVKALSAYAVPQDEIAKRIGVRSPKTLRKYFREELDNGAVDANCTVAKALFRMATSGEHPAATIFWLKARAGWKDRPATDYAAIQASPFIVAKEKEIAQ